MGACDDIPFGIGYPTMRLAIIGGAGFIGRYLATALLAAGNHVTVAGRRPRHLAGVGYGLDYLVSDCDADATLDSSAGFRCVRDHLLG